MEIVLSYDWRPEELERAILAIEHRSRIAQWTVAAGCLLIAGRALDLLVEGTGPADGDSFLLCLFMAVGLSLILSLTVRSRRSARAEAARQCVPTQNFLTDTNVRTEKTYGRGDVKWAAIRKTRQTREFFLLYTAKKRAILIPKRAFDPAQRAEFEAFIDALASARSRTSKGISVS